MERKIGEIFKYAGEWYQCVEWIGPCCEHCDLKFNECNEKCDCDEREDGKNIIFKKLEKVGEPYAEGNSIVSERMFQKYRTHEKNFFLNERDLLFTSYGDIVSIAIKQNQEDMEENKMNLKPFDLEAARRGKTVCTHDGRKARIICFDRKGKYSIVALINEGEEELLFNYNNDGYFNGEDDASGYDLMMLPEKKEGWINIIIKSNGDSYTGNRIYKSKEEAVDGSKDILCKEVITTKIQWEE